MAYFWKDEGERRHGGSTYQQDFGQQQQPKHQQAQSQLLRSLQASKQMLYDVYGNVISILEELEDREMKGKGLGRSPISLPDQRSKNDRDVQKIVEAQLVVFQSQLANCPKDASQEIKEDLKQKTLLWNSRRAEQRAPKGRVDEYIAQLFEIIATGKSSNPAIYSTMPQIAEQELRGVYQGYLYGDNKRAQLDKEFRDNPGKHARAPDVRQGRSMSQGAGRLLEFRPDLAPHVNRYRNDLR